MNRETVGPQFSAIGSAETNGRGWNALSASLPEDGRCTLPLREFNFHPLGSMARAGTRAICFLGLRANLWLAGSSRKKEVPYQNRIITVCVEPSEDVG